MRCLSKTPPSFLWTQLLRLRSITVLCVTLFLSGQPALSADRLAETEGLIARLVEESQKHRVRRKEDPKDPVWNAEVHAAGLADDIPLFNERMLEVIRAYAARGDLAEAAYLAEQLPAAGNPLAHAELAVFHARKQDAAAAGRHLASAQAGISIANRMQANVVRGHCAHALHLLGRADEAAALEAPMDEQELLSLEIRLQQDDLGAPLTLAQAQERLTAVKAKGIDELRCRFLLACAERHFRSGAQAEGLPFLSEVGQLASANGLPPAQHLLLELASVAWRAGQRQEAQKALNLFLKCCEAYADHAEWKAPFMADAAAVLLDWKREDEARAWLKAAEATLTKVFVLDAPASILAVGRQSDRLDGAVEGDRFAKMAAQAGMSHPHPRARASAAVRICLYYAQLGRPVPRQVSAILNDSKEETE